MAQRVGVLLAGPAVDLVRAGQSGLVDVDYIGVGSNQFVVHGVGRAIDFLGDLQTLAAAFGQPDQLLQPGRAGGLQVQASIQVADDLADARVERELVATGVYRDLQVRLHAELVDGPLDHRNV